MQKTGDTIYILGAGAIGKALAVFLTREQRKVALIRTSMEDYTLRKEELTVALPDGSWVGATVTIGTIKDFPILSGIIVIASKAFANEAVARSIRQKVTDAPVIVMQNGLNVEQAFAEFNTVYRCVLFATSQVTGEHTVRFKPVNASQIGSIQGDASGIQAIVAALDTPHFRFSAEENIQPVIWKKAIANCVFNSICPLLDIDNGLFHRNAEAQRLAESVIAECTEVARETGIVLDRADILQTVLMISKASDGQAISTLQDIRNGRNTEIESLNFAVADIAARMNKSFLVPQTKLLGELTRLKASVHKAAS